MVICTGGIHHVPDNRKEELIKKIASLVSEGGFVVIADPHIDDEFDHSYPHWRALGGAELGDEYIRYTIKESAPPHILAVAADILKNDLLLVEWKITVELQEALLSKHFSKVEKLKVWPDDAHEMSYGDYVFIVSN